MLAWRQKGKMGEKKSSNLLSYSLTFTKHASKDCEHNRFRSLFSVCFPVSRFSSILTSSAFPHIVVLLILCLACCFCFILQPEKPSSLHFDANKTWKWRLKMHSHLADAINKQTVISGRRTFEWKHTYSRRGASFRKLLFSWPVDFRQVK